MARSFANIPDELWDQIVPIIGTEADHPSGGRPRSSDRRCLNGMIYRLRTGCQWRAIPRAIAVPSTAHRRFQEWVNNGKIQAIYEKLLQFYADLKGIDLEWASIDSATVKAPRGGEDTGRNPTDRGKSGTKRHIVTEGQGIPIAVTISAANVHDKKMAVQAVDSVALKDGRGTRRPAHLCMDKGYDYPDIEDAIRGRNITPHIRRRGEAPLLGVVAGKPRRWMVERTNSWHNRCRGLLVRWERKSKNYHGLVLLASGLMAFYSSFGGIM